MVELTLDAIQAVFGGSCACFCAHGSSGTATNEAECRATCERKGEEFNSCGELECCMTPDCNGVATINQWCEKCSSQLRSQLVYH